LHSLFTVEKLKVAFSLVKYELIDLKFKFSSVKFFSKFIAFQDFLNIAYLLSLPSLLPPNTKMTPGDLQNYVNANKACSS
jgi:hypothetical protein